VVNLGGGFVVKLIAKDK